MELSLIVAMSKNGVIGNNGVVPWNISGDLYRFRMLTLGHYVVMGRKTYESIRKKLGGHLDGRVNVILTRQKHFKAKKCIVVGSKEEALNKLKKAPKNVFVIGGSEIYDLFLPHSKRIFMTLVDAICDGDAFFPKINECEWHSYKGTYHPPDQKNSHGFSFIDLRKK